MVKKFFYYQFPWLFLMLIIFIQSSIGSLKLPDIKFDFMDKIVHFIIFGILGILTARGLKRSSVNFLERNYLILTILICVLYAASDEIHQYYVPGRHASWGDWIADALGIFIMVFIYHRFIMNKSSKNVKLGKDRSMV